MLCTECGKRKAKLYVRNKYFRCKPCNGLVNHSSQHDKIDGEIAKARKILSDIGRLDKCNILNTPRLYDDMRPRGMHRKLFRSYNENIQGQGNLFF